MSKNKKENSGLKKADQLIEEALLAMEKREAEESSHPKPPADAGHKQPEVVIDEDTIMSDEVKLRPPTPAEPSREPETLAKIEPKQFIEKEIYLRLAADFENFRKRAIKERQEAERSGRERILRGFLEILDNLERGLIQAKDEKGPLADGIRIILSQVETWLRAEGLERIESVDKIFDPAFHEAISQIDSDKPAGVVAEEIKRGYKWGTRLLRPATVVVSRGSPEKKPSEGSE